MYQVFFIKLLDFFLSGYTFYECRFFSLLLLEFSQTIFIKNLILNKKYFLLNIKIDLENPYL